MPRDMDVLDFRRMLFIGGRISNEQELFKIFAKLGYEEAEQYALLEFFKWFIAQDLEKVDAVDIAQKYYEFFGMARVMPTLKELTRISMILGDTTDLRSFKSKRRRRQTKLE